MSKILVNLLEFTPPISHSIDSSTSLFRVVSHRNIHRKLRESLISSSFVNSANSHDIANKLIVGRDRINVSTKPGNYYISSVSFLSALFWEFLMLVFNFGFLILLITVSF